MMNQNICRLCYRPILRGVNLSNGTIIHEQCLLSAQQKAGDLSEKNRALENSLRILNEEMLRRETFVGKLSSFFSGSSSYVQAMRQRSGKITAEIQAHTKELGSTATGLLLVYDYFLTYPPDFKERKKRVAARDGECCSRCGRRDDLHLHHIKPLSSGGNNKLENLTLLCGRCHSKTHHNRVFTETFENQETAYSKRVNDLRRAIEAGQRVKFGYRKTQDKGYKQRTIKPIELFNMDHDRDSGSTLCVWGFCELRQANRTFSIKRMQGLKVL